jgi:anti-anti-sigma factor
MSRFSFSVEIESDCILVIKPKGALDFHTVGILKQAIYPLAISEEITDIVFDYSDVNYSDSSAFGLLLKLNRTVDGEVSVINANPFLKKLFKISGFDTVFFRDKDEDRDYIA